MKAIFSLILLCAPLLASIGQITALRGDVYIQRDYERFAARKASELERHDAIITGANGMVQIRFSDNTQLSLGKNSNLNIDEYLLNGSQSALNLRANSGSYKVVSGRIGQLARDNFKFNAKTLSVGIRGTEFVGDMSRSGGKIACTKGAVDISLGGQKKRLNAGEQASYELDEIMHIGNFSAMDFDILKELAPGYKAPQSAADYINSSKKQLNFGSRSMDTKRMFESSGDGEDALDKIMGY